MIRLPQRSEVTWPSALLGPGKVADLDDQPSFRALEISTIDVGNLSYRVDEDWHYLNPFAVLGRFKIEERRSLGQCLLVMPVSGHFGLILRDLVIALLEHCDVAVLDWVNARHIPLSAGEFGFAENISSVVEAIGAMPQQTHLVGICQGAIPAAAAAIASYQANASAVPASLVLIGGPVDPSANLTRVASLLANTPTSLLEDYALSAVSDAYAGRGRQVYSARSQQQGLLLYLSRQFWQNGPLIQTVAANDGIDPDRFPFLTVFTTVKDIPATGFIESIQAIYQHRSIWTHSLHWQGAPLRPEMIDALPLMTIEAAAG